MSDFNVFYAVWCKTHEKFVRVGNCAPDDLALQSTGPNEVVYQTSLRFNRPDEIEWVDESRSGIRIKI